MVENEPNIYIAYNSIEFGRDARFGTLFFRKNMAPRENPSLMQFGAIKMEKNISNITTFHLVDRFIQNLVYWQKMKN